MKKILLLVLILTLGTSLFGCSSQQTSTDIKGSSQQTVEDNEKAVKDLVNSFGKKLQMVSLQAQSDEVAKSMQENYGGLVTPELLLKWQNNPQSAPGRMVSSPWPDHIDILSTEKVSESEYKVEGQIIELTSKEAASGEAAAKRPITLDVKKDNGSWMISDVTLGDYINPDSVVYKNTEYGFSFTLPLSWKGYLVVNDKWEGLAVGGTQNGKVVQTGPIIYLRHPEWTSKNPRQDIPIMVFTLSQWESLKNEQFHIGAAPIGPTELGRNSKYVFALPARYNFAFLTGYEEVEKIIEGNPLKPI